MQMNYLVILRRRKILTTKSMYSDKKNNALEKLLISMSKKIGQYVRIHRPKQTVKISDKWGCTETRFRPEPRFYRILVQAGTKKKAWPEAELARFQKDRISSLFIE